MTTKWNEDKIKHQKEVFKKQLETGNGRFALFVLRTYKYIMWECKNNDNNWCYANKIGGRNLTAYVYNGPEDHMSYEVVEDAKKNLKMMGYIKYKKEGDVWRVYIEKQIDFCNINQYVQDNPGDENFFDIVYNHLLMNGIKIYKYKKICWRCHKEMDVYTYFLGKQLEMEIGEKYIPNQCFIKNNQLFDVTGIGRIEELDIYLSKMYPNIQKKFSKEMGESYYMNCCQHCNAHQGINFTVYRPIELMNIDIRNLKKIEINEIDIKEAGISQSIIKKLYK